MDRQRESKAEQPMASKQLSVATAIRRESTTGKDASKGIGGSEAEEIDGVIEASRDLAVGMMDKVGKEAGGLNGEDKEGGSGDIRVGEGKTGGAEEVKCKLLVDSRGQGSDNLLT